MKASQLSDNIHDVVFAVKYRTIVFCGPVECNHSIEITNQYHVAAKDFETALKLIRASLRDVDTLVQITRETP